MKSSLNKKLLLALPILALAAARAQAATRVQWLMGTFCGITASGPRADEALTAAFSEIARWDGILSLYKPNSELSQLNRSAARTPFACSESLWEVVTVSLELARQSRGSFDPTILPAIKEGPKAIRRVGFRKVILDPPSRTVAFTHPGMGLDFGGIGKGIALDHAGHLLRTLGVTAAFINFGGQLLAFGAPPNQAGWPINIPKREEEYLLRDASVSSSGDSERPGHILDPRNGRPVHRGPATVIAATATEADAWSTALYVLGEAPADFSHCAIFAGRPPPACRSGLLSRKGNYP